MYESIQDLFENAHQIWKKSRVMLGVINIHSPSLRWVEQHFSMDTYPIVDPIILHFLFLFMNQYLQISLY